MCLKNISGRDIGEARRWFFVSAVSLFFVASCEGCSASSREAYSSRLRSLCSNHEAKYPSVLATESDWA